MKLKNEKFNKKLLDRLDKQQSKRIEQLQKEKSQRLLDKTKNCLLKIYIL